jgi:hypothetical protein
MATLIGILGHRVLAPDGAIHPTLVAAALFIPSMVLLLDAQVIRAGYRAEGFRELARAGLELREAWLRKLAGGVLFGFRFLLSVAMAQFIGIAAALTGYHADIAVELTREAQRNNAPLVAAATVDVDAENAQTADAVKASEHRVDVLDKQIASTLRYLRSSTVWRNRERAHQAETALPELQRDLRATTAELNSLRDELARQTKGRADTIQIAIDNSPERVEPNTGILAQISALQRITAGSKIVFFVALLVDLICFGLDLAGVACRLTTFCPTTYAALVAKDSYVRVAEMVDEIVEITNRRDRTDGDPFGPPDPPGPGRGSRSNVTWFPGANERGKPPTGKRPRWRPRKNKPDDDSPVPVA